jgi:type IV pilus assembly protein PilE
MKNKIFTKKVKSLTLTELLVVMVIIGILTFLALPKLMPLVTKARSKEAETNLKHIQNLQKAYKLENAKFCSDLDELGFEIDKSVLEDKENGTAYYEYKIVNASTSNFKANAKALVDFDDDGTLNLWEISETGKATELVKD